MFLIIIPVARGPREVFNKENDARSAGGGFAKRTGLRQITLKFWIGDWKQGFASQSDVISRIMIFEFVYLFTTQAR